MERLTYKLDEPYKTQYLFYKYMRIADYDIKKGNYGRITDAMIYNKLGELEDVLEEFELTSAEDLRNHLNFQDNMAIWEGELNYKNKIADLEQQLAELKQKAIVPKYKVGQDVFIILDDVVNKTSINSITIFTGNELSYYCKNVGNKRMYLELDEEEIFATKEEAEQSLLNALEDK